MKIDPSVAFKRCNQWWRQGRAREHLALHTEEILGYCRSKFDKITYENCIFSHLSPSVGSSNPSAGRFLGPPLGVIWVISGISKICLLFLKVSNTYITAEVIGKRLNRVCGYGLEIPVIYHFHGQEKLVNWAVKKLEAVESHRYLKKYSFVSVFCSLAPNFFVLSANWKEKTPN